LFKRFNRKWSAWISTCLYRCEIKEIRCSKTNFRTLEPLVNPFQCFTNYFFGRANLSSPGSAILKSPRSLKEAVNHLWWISQKWVLRDSCLGQAGKKLSGGFSICNQWKARFHHFLHLLIWRSSKRNLFSEMVMPRAIFFSNYWPLEPPMNNPCSPDTLSNPFSSQTESKASFPISVFRIWPPYRAFGMVSVSVNFTRIPDFIFAF